MNCTKIKRHEKIHRQQTNMRFDSDPIFKFQQYSNKRITLTIRERIQNTSLLKVNGL
jgi:hypothetical protein